MLRPSMYDGSVPGGRGFLTQLQQDWGGHEKRKRGVSDRPDSSRNRTGPVRHRPKSRSSGL